MKNQYVYSSEAVKRDSGRWVGYSVRTERGSGKRESKNDASTRWFEAFCLHGARCTLLSDEQRNSVINILQRHSLLTKPTSVCLERYVCKGVVPCSLTYDKIIYGVALTEWLVENAPDDLREIADLLSS